MHWYVDFRDPVPPPGTEPSPFEWAGGLPALTRMSRLFYEKHVAADPLLAPLLADAGPGPPQRLAGWLAEAPRRPPHGDGDVPPAAIRAAAGEAGQPQRRAGWRAEALGGPADGDGDVRQAAIGAADGEFGEQQRARWVALLSTAADEAALPADPEFRSVLSSCLEWASRTALALSQ